MAEAEKAEAEKQKGKGIFFWGYAVGCETSGRAEQRSGFKSLQTNGGYVIGIDHDDITRCLIPVRKIIYIRVSFSETRPRR